MHNCLSEVSINLRNILVDTNPEKRQEYAKRIVDLRTKYDEGFKQLQELTTKDDAKGNDLNAKAAAGAEKTRPLNSKVMELSLAGKDAQAIEILNKEARPALRSWLDTLALIDSHQDERNKVRFEQAESAYRNARALMLGIGSLAILLAVLITVLLARAITLPLQQAVELADKLADGDLTMVVEAHSTDETGQLLTAMGSMVARLRISSRK